MAALCSRAARAVRSGADRRGCTGIAYLEVLVAVVLLGVGLAPALEALTSAGRSTDGQYALAATHYGLQERMETLLAEPYAALLAEASTPGSPTASAAYSDTGGTPNRRLVYITAYDGDDADGNGNPFDGTDDDILWVRIEVENAHHAVESLVTR